MAAWPYLFQEEAYNIPGKVLVVIAKDWQHYSAEDKILLSRILGSVKQSLSTVQIVVQSVLNPETLIGYKPSQVLVFGSETPGINAYEACQVNELSLIKADDLPLLDDTRKRNLWIGLKNMFGL